MIKELPHSFVRSFNLKVNSSNENLSKDDAFLLLNAVQKLGPITATRLLKEFKGDPTRIFSSSKAELLKTRGIGKAAVDSLKNTQNIHWVKKERQKIETHKFSFLNKEKFPLALQEIYDCPAGLYVTGDIPQGPYVAIVGTRIPSIYGRRICREVAVDLASNGFCIVSGLARGIDAEAHLGALEADGKTIAFLGSGLDVIYPPEHLDLYRRIRINGVVASEFPLGHKANRNTFPMRNRLVSGISSAVVVIESASAGGSLITAQLAADQGRHVYALPGRVDQATSSGCHKLIREGATLIRSSQDIIDDLLPSLSEEELNLISKSSSNSEKLKDSSVTLNNDEKKIIEILKNGCLLTIDEICSAANLKHPIVSSNLIMLELNNLIGKRNDGKYEIS